MHVVSAPLGVVVLDEEVATPHSVVMRFAWFDAASPKEVQIVGVPVDPTPLGVGQAVVDAVDVGFEDSSQQVTLSSEQVGRGDPFGRRRERESSKLGRVAAERGFEVVLHLGQQAIDRGLETTTPQKRQAQGVITLDQGGAVDADQVGGRRRRSKREGALLVIE